MNVLAGDIGGTKTWLQIVDYADQGQIYSVLYEQRFASSQYPSFEQLLIEFAGSAQQAGVDLPETGCIGVAGPVDIDASGNCTAKVTNLPWRLEARKIAKDHGLRHLYLMNDFQVIGYGLELLTDDEIVVLQKGRYLAGRSHAPQALIGAGTGLGQGLLIWEGGVDDGHYVVYASEGGHCDFAPGSDEQRELLNYLSTRQTRVSVEDVLSGRGLVNVYRFLADKYPQDVHASLLRLMEQGDAAAAVSEAALSGTDELAHHAVSLFVEVYGTQAGNLVLTTMAVGGIYIAGGIAPKIQEFFNTDIFLSAFCNKGPMCELMATIPVNLVLNPKVGLKGAALVASRL